MKYFFMRFVDPDKEQLARECGFRPFKDYDGNEIWFRDNWLAPKKNPLNEVAEDDRQTWLLEHIQPGQLFVAQMWGRGPD